ncbi:MAG: hypothetical protein HOL17_06275 [Gammaproteobacteria bacterium]|jgi:hypothetical protein|nr:hypothetical protein [Gammaproteobacteria bacterium]MBT4606036.1 hypothetical protein [Thiotrichales bacterium]MBT7829788.1 hypothetical protein [Candidatus Neomarinimicrobiota bacterium]MBT4329550.1 hypothetical protein [Gammaproteobacteria bacterium]MBT5371313.1 hypothetical protein [Gammaproteobacteria bacterium]
MGLLDGMKTESAAPAENAGDQASPEEQEKFDDVVHTAMALLFEEKSSKKVLQALKSAKDPVQTVASIAVGLGEAYEKRKGDIPDEVAGPVAAEVVEMIYDYGEKAGVLEATEEDMENTLYKVYEIWGGEHQQGIDRERNAIQAGFNQIPDDVVSQAVSHIANRPASITSGVQQAARAY